MRHLKAGKSLGVDPAHKRAMMRNMVTSVLEHERVTTTLARAKEVRRPLERMITLAKRGDLAARRQALGYVQSKAVVHKLFDELATRYAERPGGYTRIIKTGNRRGDGAQMAMIILVDSEQDPWAGEKKPKRETRGRGTRRRRRRQQTAAQPAEAQAEPTPAAEAPAAEAQPAEEATSAEATATATEAPAEETAQPEAEAAAPEAEAAEEAAEAGDEDEGKAKK